jgi:uncharacterized membrane protein HdeD (DUF308 family)
MNATPTVLTDYAPKAINWSIALSILLILAGLFAIVIPSLSGIAITLFFGWAMILSGITHFIFAFKTHTTGGVIWELLIGAVYLFTGVYLILHPLAALIALTLILAIYLFFESIAEFIQFFQLRRFHGSVWILIDAVVTLVLAVMIWRSWPASTIWVIGTLVGISMIFSGFSRLMLSFAAKRVLNRVV